MRGTGALLASSCALALALVPLTAGAKPPPGGPSATWATWITRDVVISLHDLPKRYTCDDLWYKVRGVLLAIGAREYMSISPYNCGARSSGEGRSPSIEARFQTLRALSGPDARWAQTSAVLKTVRLGPGEPKILDTSDCALLSQLNGTLFSYLEVHVVATDLQCSSPQSERKFGLAVEGLVEVPAGHPPA
jgi:hypothetical protein